MYSEFNAMGKPIPQYRKDAAINYMSSVVVDLKFNPKYFVESACIYLENDEPDGAMQLLQTRIDLTGSYIMLAFLLTGENNEQN